MPDLAVVPKIVDLILDAARELAPDEWDGTVTTDGEEEEIETVEIVDGGINGETFWMKTRFVQDGAVHLLEANAPVQRAGARGGGDVIKFDGKPMLSADLVFRPIIHRFRLRISVSYKFQQAGKTVRYRFDGTVG